MGMETGKRECWLNKAEHLLCSTVEVNQVMINVLQLPLSFQWSLCSSVSAPKVQRNTHTHTERIHRYIVWLVMHTVLYMLSTHTDCESLRAPTCIHKQPQRHHADIQVDIMHQNRSEHTHTHTHPHTKWVIRCWIKMAASNCVSLLG